jgi:small subunit ribosomal protein S1
MALYQPEGKLFQTQKNTEILNSPQLLEKAFNEKKILEGTAVLCDAAHNLIIDIPNARGIIPREKGALGIAEGKTRDIAVLSRVNKPVCFVIEEIKYAPDGTPTYILSRLAAQQRCLEEYISHLSKGDIIPAKVTHLEPFGAFVDIGCGIPSMIPIDAISVSRISHPNDRFYNGQNIYAVIKDFQQDKICLTHKELLGTWEENCALFHVGETVPGIVRSVESYGIFIELAPNLAGLAEPREGVYAGQSAVVNIKAMIPEKMKIKLGIVDILDMPPSVKKIRYFLTAGNLKRWEYSPENCIKEVVSLFR